jgi:hypothetical protein
MPKDGFGRHYQPLEDRLKQVEAQIPEAQGEIDFLKIQLMSGDQIISEARDIHSRWTTLAADEKRRIAETITEQIVVGQDDVSINLCYLPSSPEMAATGQRNPMDSLRIRA